MNICTIIVVIAFASSVVLGKDEKYKKIAEECNAKVQATEDDMKLVLRHIPPSSKTGISLMTCILKTMGWLDKDNKINVETAKKDLEYLKQKHQSVYDKTVKHLAMCKSEETPEADENVASKTFGNCMWLLAKNDTDCPHAEEYARVAQECKPKVNASEDDMKLVLTFAAPSSRTGQCLLACIMKKNVWMDQDNKVNVENTRKVFEHLKETYKEAYNKTSKQLDQCKEKETSEADECVAAKKFFDCMWAE